MSQRDSKHRPITRTPEVWKIRYSDGSRKIAFKTNSDACHIVADSSNV